MLRSVHHEFHVARARRLIACRGDLLGQIRRRLDVVAVFDIEVGIENDLNAVIDDRVVINHFRDTRNQTNNQLRHVVSRRGLAAKGKAARRNIQRRIGTQASI